MVEQPCWGVGLEQLSQGLLLRQSAREKERERKKLRAQSKPLRVGVDRSTEGRMN